MLCLLFNEGNWINKRTEKRERRERKGGRREREWRVKGREERKEGREERKGGREREHYLDQFSPFLHTLLFFSCLSMLAKTSNLLIPS